jgi:hypothetical protein
MMHVRDYEKWLAKKFAREESKSGWDGDTGKFHEDRRTPRFATMGLSYERKSFGRRPFSTFGKRSFADKLKSG